MKIVLLGAPGAGKGTYASRLRKIYDVPHISTGDLLRDAVKEGSDIGLQVKEFIDKGEFVPDETIVDLLKNRLSMEDAQKGVFLDGFPRTLKQAEILDELIGVDAVLKFDLGRDVVLRRLGGRIICKGCGEIFNKNMLKPKQEGVCDHCDDELYQRDDDKDETIMERLKTYDTQTKPLIGHYKDKDILHNIDANIDISCPECTIIEECSNILDKFGLNKIK